MGLFGNLFEKKRDEQACDILYSVIDDRDGEYAVSYENVTEYYIKAEEAFNEKKYQDCIDYISKEMKATGHEIPPYFSLKGEAYALMGNYKDALTCFNKMLSIRPDHLFANEAKAVSLIMMNDFKGAIDSLSRIIEKKPKHPVFYELRAEAFEKSGNIEKRNQDIRKFNELTGEKRPILTKEGIYYMTDTGSGSSPIRYEGMTEYGTVLANKAWENKKYQECLDYLNKEFSITQEIPPLLVFRAQAYAELKKFNAALKDVNKVLSGNPRHEKANTTKATILERMGDIQGAIASISQAIEQDPNNAVYYAIRSHLYGKAGNYEKKVQDSKKFIELELK
jgi:tetratricopeptide (TPR) repeat protein